MSHQRSTCPGCGQTFVAIGRHWGYGSCDFPSIDRDQRELLAGLLLGDGFMRWDRDRDDERRASKFPKFELEVINREYIEWVADRLEPFTSNTYTHEHDDRRTSYRIYTVGHPELQHPSFWVELDRPSTLAYEFDITPAILNAAYATRGSLNWVDGGAGVRLSPHGPARPLVERFFREQGWEFTHVGQNELYLSRAHNEAFFEYTGDPPPGFEWKWRYDDEAAYRVRHASPDDIATL